MIKVAPHVAYSEIGRSDQKPYADAMLNGPVFPSSLQARVEDSTFRSLLSLLSYSL